MTTTTSPVRITGPDLELEEVESVALGEAGVELASDARERIAIARGCVDEIESTELSTYGLNTGVGRFVDTRIEPGMTAELQARVLRSHAAGVGETYAPEVVRAAHLLRVNTLALGHSGVRVELVEQMTRMLDRGLVAHVPARGSVGASGDLAPLAHLCLPLIGEGRASVDGGELVDGAAALAAVELEPLELASKEGLSLINGTQFMVAQGILALQRAERLARLADIACAMTVEALRGSRQPFNARIHELRPHPGQRSSAENIDRALEDSAIMQSHVGCDRVQDAYSLRCAPQVHGASRDSFAHARRVLAIEAVSVTDNPLVFPDEGTMRSNGNFHGQPVAIALDLMAIALAELASISERRVERLVNPALSGGLPPFLTAEGGLNSGYMIAQYTAASLVSENKVMCHPASVDSIPTSANQEDHVSMGNHGGLKLHRVLANAERVLAIELVLAAQGLDFLRPRRPGVGARAGHELVREHVPLLEDDRLIGDELELMAGVVARRGTVAELERRAGFSLS